VVMILSSLPYMVCGDSDHGDGDSGNDDYDGDGDGERSPGPSDLIVHLANSETSNYCQTKPGQEDDEGVEVEVGLALRLRLVVRPDYRQHCHALG